MDEYNYKIAVLIARVFLGVLFFIQGYDKVFKIGLKEVVRTFKAELGSSKIPGFIVVASAYYTSYIELLGGLLLILGFMQSYALYALGLDLIMVAVAMSIINPLWKMDFVFPRLVLLLFLLFMSHASDLFALDSCLFF